MYSKIRGPLSLAAAILLGLVFLASGTGKLLGEIETPGQIMAFINDILPEFLLTPPVMFFIYNILVPYLFPIAELLLGICLLIGFLPALAALLSLPLIFAFIATNVWAITAGGYQTCASCFGLWEKFFGHLSPLQSLTIDVIMAMLALAIILMQSGKFLSSRRPLSWFLERNWQSQSCRESISKLKQKFINALRRKSLRANLLPYLGYLLGLTGIAILIFLGLNNYNNYHSKDSDNVNITDITSFKATVTFTTPKPERIDLIYYDRDGRISGIASENEPSRDHSIVLDNLKPATTYYFQLLFSDSERGKKNQSPL